MKMGTAYRAIVLTGLLFPSLLTGQATGSQPEPKPAASSAQATAANTTPGHPNDYRSQHEQLLLTDFPWLARFKDEDMKLGAPAVGEDRVVFMGDSITEGWHLDTFFPGKPYVNRGISGQTTPQMVLRFHQDVISFKPKVVIILAGINDIAGNTGPMTLEQTENNLAAMTEMASANDIKVVLCSVLPAYDFPWSPGLKPAPKVVALNAWIQSFAAERHLLYADYYSPMKDDRGGLPPTLSRDGVHPLPAGYAIMVPLAEAAIEKALK